MSVAAIASLVGFATIADCAIAQKKPPVRRTMESSDLQRTLWRLVSWNGTAIDADLPEITANFSEDTVRGSGGCNNYFSGYEIASGDRMTVSPPGSTRMACEPNVMEWELNYLVSLQGTTRYDIDAEGNLHLWFETDTEAGEMVFAPSEMVQKKSF
ncbi:putative lipoprotein [Geitlerinema sp. FC II]|nr:putative lipoprotein [Geitlerinema sp. FC II]